MQADLVNTREVKLLLPQHSTMNQNIVQGIKLDTFSSMDASGQPDCSSCLVTCAQCQGNYMARHAGSLSQLFFFSLGY
jgi:hypothetical protein